jgi:hypothetical protein
MVMRILQRLHLKVGLDHTMDERPYDEDRPTEEKEELKSVALILRKLRRPAPAFDREKAEN